MKKGDQVIQIQPEPIVGIVEGFQLCQETGVVMARVEWKDDEGVIHARHFRPEEIKLNQSK